MKILVAEDEPSILMQYRLALETRGHQVTCTENGFACLQEYRAASTVDGHAPFDAVVLDYRMPVIDGLSAAKEILQLCPRQRIIFASAYVADTLRDSAKELHQIVELLQKPFELDRLVEIVEDVGIYRELAALNVRVKNLKDHNLSLKELVGLLEGVKKLQAMVAAEQKA